ncbi:hypothetical protein [Lysobacter sp. TAB13]|uniref:hypothetical protein n=1 Tax=Lysobacter sp. TAB13 TaxID=3233065 RepID=UPI003F9CDF89
MNEYRHHIQTRGHYQIVALTRDSEYEQDDVYAYAIMSSAGVKLHQEVTLSEAQIWLDDRILKDLIDSSDVSPDMMSPSRRVERSGLRSGRKRS